MAHRFDAEAVAHLARLARLRVPQARAEALAGELSRIVGYVDQLATLEGVTASVEPAPPLPRRNDQPGASLPELVSASAGAAGRMVALPVVVSAGED
jgi:aspartyl/glutamyl-tRNA(Asn/Gln) amidotransferase C subunit